MVNMPLSHPLFEYRPVHDSALTACMFPIPLLVLLLGTRPLPRRCVLGSRLVVFW
ncbi:hypothetical protein EJ02DRAFT_52846 [Clathrospora elynae]|uniref:Uncharacterized protein n=1 Tax=Clathrospora elynae TaxID=706981 RepID=A0A6A5SY29_9PLEO|nr:hypothetical protein EJ02DRAFT_52846 [Clathrospora elynae]